MICLLEVLTFVATFWDRYVQLMRNIVVENIQIKDLGSIAQCKTRRESTYTTLDTQLPLERSPSENSFQDQLQSRARQYLII